MQKIVFIIILVFGMCSVITGSTLETSLSVKESKPVSNVISHLIHMGATKTNIKDQTQVFIQALIGHDINKALELLDLGIDVNGQYGRNFTPLHWAILYGNHNIVEQLINSKADVNSKSCSGRTPLDLADHRNLKSVIELLIQNNADVSQKLVRDKKISIDQNDIYGVLKAQQLIKNLKEKNYQEAREWLQRGIDVNYKDESGRTPLHLAVDCHTYSAAPFDFIELLVKNKACVNAQDKHGETPLHAAARDRDIIELLINSGADVNIRNNTWSTPLCFAIRVGNKDGASLLIKAGADINAKDQEGNTLLHCHSNNDAIQKAQLLIELSADVNAKNQKGEMPLHLAAYSRNKETVNLLIKNKADVNARNNEGLTPLVIAAQVWCAPIIAALKKAGAHWPREIVQPKYYNDHFDDRPWWWSSWVLHCEKIKLKAQLTQSNA